MIKFRCPSCQTKLGVPDEYANHRVRCNQCGQPCIVPKPIERVTVETSLESISRPASATTARPVSNIQPDKSQSHPVQQHELIEESGLDIQDDPNAAILRQIQKEKAAKQKSKNTPDAKSAKAPSPKAGTRQRGRSEFSLTEIVPDALHFPLSVVLGLAATAATIGIWIIAAQKAQNPLTFFTMLIPWSAAAGIRLLSVNRTFALGTMAAIIGIAGIGLGRVIVAKMVVVHLLHNQACQEVLREIPDFLSNPKLQIPPNVSAKSIVQNGGLLTCTAVIAAVDQDKADPVMARNITLHILQEIDKSLIEQVEGAGTAPHVHEMSVEDAEKMAKMFEKLEKNKNNPDAMKEILENNKNADADAAPLTEQQRQQQFIEEKVNAYFETWENDNSAAMSAARKYYPVLSQLRLQSKLLKILQEPQQAFHFALLTTLGILDVAWLLAGLCGAYVMAAFEI